MGIHERVMAVSDGHPIPLNCGRTLGVAYLNDSSLHGQMVRFATVQLRAGHLPLSMSPDMITRIRHLP
jgi:hypothetical protein